MKNNPDVQAAGIDLPNATLPKDNIVRFMIRSIISSCLGLTAT